MTTATEVLKKANQIFNINPRLGQSLVDAASKLRPAGEDDQRPEPAPTSIAPELPKALKGLNPKLLEKIRAKVRAGII